MAKGQFLYVKCFLEGMGTGFDRNEVLAIMVITTKRGSSDAVEYIETNGITEKMLLQAASDSRGRQKPQKNKKCCDKPWQNRSLYVYIYIK